MSETFRAVGIVAEFNPFHEGHEYLIKRAKELSGAKYAVIAMSGDFVQRGECACMHKYERARHALKHGADVVLGMPVYSTLSAAGEFAKSYIRALINAGVDAVAFGCEDVRIVEILTYIKRHIMDSGNAIDNWARVYMRMGDPYPVAREKTFRELCGMPEEFIEMIRKPNNLLVFEYLKTVCEMGAADRVKIIPIKREGMPYHDYDDEDKDRKPDVTRDFEGNKKYPSASYIRNRFKEGEYTYDYIEKYASKYSLLSWNSLSQMLYYRLLFADRAELSLMKDVNEDLAARILSEVKGIRDPEELIAAVKNKSVTYTRISRCLAQSLLYLPKRKDRPGYVYLLGVRTDAYDVLHRIKLIGRLKVITKTADAKKLLSEDAMEFYYMDRRANEIFVGLSSDKGEKLKEDYYMTPVMV